MADRLYKPKRLNIPSPNHSPRPGGAASIRGLIVHWTGTPASVTAEAVANYLARPAVQASAHRVIGKSGTIVRCVSFNRAAWHAGLAHCDFNNDGDFNDPGEKSVNASTVGIEFCGTYGGPWPDAQMWSGAYVMRAVDVYAPNFRPRNVTDHQKVALPHGRKVDVDASFRCEAMFWWFCNPNKKLPSSTRKGVYNALPLWARRNCDEIWGS